MSSETIDYAAVLADLEAKRAAIDGTIAGIRQMLNLGAEQGETPTAGAERVPVEVRSDTFFRMTMPDAIVKFLEIAKRPRTLSEITKALEDGGLPTTAKNLMPIVGSNLSRLKTAGEVCQPAQGKWGLAAWYPALARQIVTAKPTGKKRGRPKGSTKPKVEATRSDTKSHAPKPTPEQIEQIKKLGAVGKKPGEIAKEVGLHHFAVMGILKSKEAAA